jgi:hypothetical protein
VNLPVRNFIETKYTCQVTGSNRNGKITRELTVTVPVAPTATTSPRIEGVGWSITPTLNQSLTCTPPSYRPAGVASSIAWFATSSQVVDPSTGTLVGEGSFLVMSEGVEAAMAGRPYLHCVVTGSNLGGSIKLASFRVLVNLPFTR